ncbi:MAG TPA: tetratricopeptide repeat protein, partial [Flavobacteriaceae bacterium]|nr:tetratricopeptide repeat protein [Flavobacteriaceae bacterium]
NAYEFMNKGDVAVEKGNFKEAKRLYKKAQELNPSNLEMQYWYAITLLNNKEFDEAKLILKSIFAKNKNWKKLTPRLIKSGLLQISENELTKIMLL